MKDLSVLAISAVSAVVVGFLARSDDSSVDAIIGMVFFLPSVFFWGRLFAGEPLGVLWLLLVTMAIAALPIAWKSPLTDFVCVVTTSILLTVDTLVLSKVQRKPLPRWTGEEPGAVWDPDLDRRNQELVDNYERSKGALILDNADQTGESRHRHHEST